MSRGMLTEKYFDFLESEIDRLEFDNECLRKELAARLANEKVNTVDPINNPHATPINIRKLSKLAQEAAEDIKIHLEYGDKTRLQLTNMMQEFAPGVIKNALEYLWKSKIIDRYPNPKYGKEFMYCLPKGV